MRVQANNEIRALTAAELEAVAGAGDDYDVVIGFMWMAYGALCGAPAAAIADVGILKPLPPR